jgi:hypothetical protein
LKRKYGIGGAIFHFQEHKMLKIVEHRQMHLVGQSSSSRRELKVQENVEVVEVSTLYHNPKGVVGGMATKVRML